MITDETKKNEAIIAAHMIANTLDYHNFDNGQYMLTEHDGIWLCNADDSKVRKITANTWIQSDIKTSQGYFNVIDIR